MSIFLDCVFDKSIASYRFKRSYFPSRNKRTNVGENYFSHNFSNVTFSTYSHPNELTKDDQKYSGTILLGILFSNTLDDRFSAREKISLESDA